MEEYGETTPNLSVGRGGVEAVGGGGSAETMHRQRRELNSCELRRAQAGTTQSKNFNGARGRWKEFGLRQCRGGSGSSTGKKGTPAKRRRKGVRVRRESMGWHL